MLLVLCIGAVPHFPEELVFPKSLDLLFDIVVLTLLVALVETGSEIAVLVLLLNLCEV